ncbi:DivIVA domain-containing protein [Kribbella catacumbae]|uniref:DivIVA domain-containing protein n=1 Tax=Kribbella catacumbae TaxID=460086 RepID=UPI000365E560|nr:DivIVA domain-containing protein [Kribbella catacumbae]
MEPLFTRVRWREGYDVSDVDAFIERLMATVEGRYVEHPVTADDIRNVIFTPVRLREGYAVGEVDAFLDQALQSMLGGPAADRPGDRTSASPADRPVDRTSADRPAASRRQRDAPRFSPVKLREGYDMAEVDDFVDRVMATVNGLPVDRPVTSSEVRTIQFSSVRIREGYDVMEVDLFLEEAEGWLNGFGG